MKLYFYFILYKTVLFLIFPTFTVTDDKCSSDESNGVDLSKAENEIYYLCQLAFNEAREYSSNIDQLSNLFEHVEHIQSLQKSKPIFNLGNRDDNRMVKMNTFLSWSFDKFYANGIAPYKFDIGIGLITTKRLNQGDVIIRVPYEVTINSNEANITFGGLAEGLKLVKDVKSETLWNEHALVALLLLKERLDPDSFWKPYLDILPSDDIHPLDFGINEFDVLQGSSTYHQCLEQSQDMIAQYAFLYRLIYENPSEFNVHGITVDTFTYQAYRWAMTMVLTRSFDFDPGLILVPMWDLLNHGEDMTASSIGVNEPKLSWELSDKDSVQIMFEGSVTQDIQIRQQLFVEYCPEKDATFDSLFVTWGLVENKRGRIAVAIRLDRSHGGYRFRERALHKLMRNYNIERYEIQVMQQHKRAYPIARWDLNLLWALCCGKSRGTRKVPSKYFRVSTRDWKRMFFYLAKQIIRAIARYTHDLRWYRIKVANSEMGSLKLLVYKEIKAELELLNAALSKCIMLSQLQPMTF